MADYPLTIHVPEQLYEQLRQRALQSAQPIEELLMMQLTATLFEPIPPEDRAEISALQRLSDEALWTLAAEQMPRADQERLSLLLALNKRASLSEVETSELDGLVERGDRLICGKRKQPPS
jgi:hypothetical protein